MEFLAALSPGREVRLSAFACILLRRAVREGVVTLVSPEGHAEACRLAANGLAILDGTRLTITEDGLRALALVLLDGGDVPEIDLSDL